MEKEIKRVLEGKKKDQRTLLSENARVKQARIFEKTHDEHASGIDCCGYNRKYDKGINLLRVGWGYEALSQQEFHELAGLMRGQRGEGEEEGKEMEEVQLRLARHRSNSGERGTCRRSEWKGERTLMVGE